MRPLVVTRRKLQTDRVTEIKARQIQNEIKGVPCSLRWGARCSGWASTAPRPSPAGQLRSHWRTPASWRIGGARRQARHVSCDGGTCKTHQNQNLWESSIWPTQNSSGEKLFIRSRLYFWAFPQKLDLLKMQETRFLSKTRFKKSVKLDFWLQFKEH